MSKHDNSINNDYQGDEEAEATSSVTRVIEQDKDTYPISDSESTTDSISNIVKDEDQGELNHSMSQDSLINDEQENNKIEQFSSLTTTAVNSRMNSKLKSSTNGNRSGNLDEHIKLVKQKKEEADVLRLQRFQEQLKKKEQKRQQQQIEKVKKWLQLRNRDTDHRSQVEERRKKREEEVKAKIDDILRREKEREQKTVNLRTNVLHKPDAVMSLSTDILSTRRAISTPRSRTNQQDMTNQRGSNDSPITTTSQDNADNSTTTISSPQRNPIDGQRCHQHSRRSQDTTMTNEDSSLSGTPRSSARGRTRALPASYTYWFNTGDNNNNMNASFMRLTYAATCRSRLSRSVERCPRSCRARDDIAINSATTATTNGEPHRRIQSINRQHLNETILRLSKPKSIPTTQSIHIGATATNGIASSQSSHQLRVPTPPVITNNYLTPTATSNNRRHINSRPVTAPSHHVSSISSTVPNSSNDSRASPISESTSGHHHHHHHPASSIKQSSHRTTVPPKILSTSSAKPSTLSSSSRPKPPTQRSTMSTSHSSSAIASSATTNKQNIRRIGGTLPSKQKPTPEPLPSVETPDNQISIKDNHQEEEEDSLPVNDDTQEEEQEEEEEEEAEKGEQQMPPAEDQPSITSVEPINIDIITEIISPPVLAPTSKREQQLTGEQDYQRKLNQKIREAQQRLEVERQQEEERKRQLELEEYEREQEQIRLVEDQARAEQERLQRAIEECDRENELKRQEEQRLQQQREELEKKQAEETERLNRERQERTKKEEEERNERKKRLDLIMRRTRQVSPTSKQPENKINMEETNEQDHSISDNRIPNSSSTDNLISNDSTTADAPKFKSPLIQNLLNKARNTRSTDNLSQSNMTTSQIMTESMVDEGTTVVKSATSTDLSDDDDDRQDSGINNTINGHTDSHSSSSSYHDRPIETATAFQ